MRKKCPYSELLWSAYFLHFPAFGLNTPCLSVFSPNAGKCGKNADQNNPKYRLFLHSERFTFDHTTKVIAQTFPSGCKELFRTIYINVSKISS